MNHPVETAAVWRGRELFDRPDWQWTLTSDDAAELQAAHAATASLPLEHITRQRFELPGLSARLDGLQHSLEHGSGVTMVRGLPVDSYSAQDAMRIFYGIAQHLGTPVSQTPAGDRVFHVRDEGFHEKDARARGPNTRKKLSFHTDRCDVIAFCCLKQAKSGGENCVVSSAALYNEVLARRPDLLVELLQPFYYQRHNVDTGNDLAYCRQPVFSFRDGHFAASFLRVLIERAYRSPDIPDMRAEQREALDYLEALADDPALHVSFRQEPGDMLFLNNWVTFHRRAEFEDYVAVEQKRHLLRIWLSVPNSRPLDPCFLDNYGAVEAGAVRGGMRPRLE